jgi:hypothetical protein
MPEGHVLHRLAREHEKALADAALTVSSPQGRLRAAAADLDGTTLTFSTRIDTPAEARDALVELLNARLADAFDLYSQLKRAHWNAKGSDFIQLHALYARAEPPGPSTADDRTPQNVLPAVPLG